MFTRSDADIDPHAFWSAQERFGEQTVQWTMRDAAVSNTPIAAYLQALQADRDRQTKGLPGGQHHLETAAYQQL